MIKVFKDFLKENYNDSSINIYELALKHKLYGSIIEMFRKLQKDIVSVPLSYLGISLNEEVKNFCLNHNIEIVVKNNKNYLVFNNE